MTRLLDRYILGIFIPALALFTVTLLFLFIAVDFAAKLGKFLELKDQPLVPFILKFYLYRIPMLLVILIPAVLIFAPTFTVIKLARANEILPIATSGISLRRMSMPFLVTAMLASIAMGAMEEFVLPRVGIQIAKSDAELARRGFDWNVEDYDGRTKLWAKHYTMKNQLLSMGVRITRLDDSMQPVEIITAQRAQWNARLKRWVAFEGSVEYPLDVIKEPGKKPYTKKEEIPPDGKVVECDLTPQTLQKDMGGSNRGSFDTLQTQIQEMNKYPHVPAFVLRVHARFSFPLSPIVLLLVGLPFVMDPHSKSFVKGLIFCFLLSLGFYVTHFQCADLGNKGRIPPLVAAWFPILSFGTAGLLAFARMRT
jgi:lipopolysaccharide export system permease protein